MTMSRRGRVFYGWRVVSAAFVLAVFGWGMGFYGPPVFLSVVREARGWPLTLISTAVTLPYHGRSIADTSRTQRHDTAAALCNGTPRPALPSTSCAFSAANALRLMMPRAVTLGTRTWIGLERPSRIGEENDIVTNAGLLVDYWTEVAEHMPDWSVVLSGRKRAIELRQERISSHSTVLRALGGLGVDLMASAGWQSSLMPLARIDWSKKNPEWENICIVGGSVLSNRQARAATKAFIKAKLGLDLSDAEQRSIDRAKGNDDQPSRAMNLSFPAAILKTR
jgi:hypothetical protein